MTHDLLTDLYPKLMPALLGASEASNAKVCRRVVLLAVRRAVLSDRRVDDGIDILEGRCHSRPEVVTALRTLIDELDDQAWSVQEQDPTNGSRHLGVFKQARAASALASAVDGQSTAFVDTLYEAHFAVDDVVEFEAEVRMALKND